jgi:hypothetical protein
MCNSNVIIFSNYKVFLKNIFRINLKSQPANINRWDFYYNENVNDSKCASYVIRKFLPY